MTRHLLIGGAAFAALAAAPALAMDRYGTPAPGARSAAASDPDAGLERLAAASTPTDAGHGKPARSMRSILRDDSYLESAFASLDNR